MGEPDWGHQQYANLTRLSLESTPQNNKCGPEVLQITQATIPGLVSKTTRI